MLDGKTKGAIILAAALFFGLALVCGMMCLAMYRH